MQLLFVPSQLPLKLSPLLADLQRIHRPDLVPFGVLKIAVNRIKELLILLEGRQNFMGKLFLKFSRLGWTHVLPVARAGHDFIERDELSLRLGLPYTDFLVGNVLFENSIRVLHFSQLAGLLLLVLVDGELVLPFVEVDVFGRALFVLTHAFFIEFVFIILADSSVKTGLRP